MLGLKVLLAEESNINLNCSFNLFLKKKKVKLVQIMDSRLG